jgi:hypothetical protein
VSLLIHSRAIYHCLVIDSRLSHFSGIRVLLLMFCLKKSWRLCLFTVVSLLIHLCPIVDPVLYLVLHFTPHYFRIVRTLSAALYVIIDLPLYCWTSKVAFYIFIQQLYVPNILNMVYTLRFFSSKCSLFHNSNVFGSCIIHFIYRCAKIKKIIPTPKG